MWEAIESNHRRSWILISLMATVLVSLGGVIGVSVFSGPGWLVGVVIALAIWGGLMALTFLQGENMVLMAAGARRLRRQDSPRLFNIVEEMTIASGLGTPPAVYIIEDSSPNAFAVGRAPETAAVAVTSGLLTRLNRDELQGVIAHEIAHIKNHDIRFMTIASVMVGSIVLLSKLYLRYLVFGGGRRRGSSRGSGGTVWFVVIAAIAAVLAPLAAYVLYFACSRRREYLADASAARFTRFPDGLASALEKIAGRSSSAADVNQALVPMYIVNPLQGAAPPRLFSTHPPTSDRVKILRSMGGKAGLLDYESAYRRIHGGKSRCIGIRTLSSGESRSLVARPATAESEAPQQSIERAREVSDLLSRMAELLVLTCTCGVRIKVPSGCDRDSIPCPRCGTEHRVPRASSGPAGNAEDRSTANEDAPERSATEEASLRFERSGSGWESFQCTCGRVIQIAPGFQASRARCPDCRKTIAVVEKEPAVAEPPA